MELQSMQMENQQTRSMHRLAKSGNPTVTLCAANRVNVGHGGGGAVRRRGRCVVNAEGFSCND
jgi:hypothetical protein